MKVLALVLSAFVLATFSDGANIGGIIGNVLSLTEISLKLGDIVTGGCVFVPEVCTLRSEIEAMERQLNPKMTTLLALHDANQKKYQKLTDVIYKNRDLVGIQDNIEGLIASLVNTLDDKSSQLSQLEQEFNYGRNGLSGIFRNDVKEFTLTDRSLDTASLMYHELKYTFDRLKKDGQFNGFNNFEEVIAAIGKPVIKPLVSPSPLKYTNAYTNINKAFTFLKKDGPKNWLQYSNKFGPVVFSLYGIVANLVFDIQASLKMRDSMRQTRDQMREMLKEIDPLIGSAYHAKADLESEFVTQREFFLRILKAVQYSVFINLDADAMTNSNIDAIMPAQQTTVNEMEAVGKTLQQQYTRQRQRITVRLGVQFGDSISQMQSRLARSGLPTLPEYLVLRMIAIDFPDKTRYDGKALPRV